MTSKYLEGGGGRDTVMLGRKSICIKPDTPIISQLSENRLAGGKIRMRRIEESFDRGYSECEIKVDDCSAWNPHRSENPHRVRNIRCASDIH
ncbi:hypothetical protein D3C76_1254720 [compost metagenome]